MSSHPLTNVEIQKYYKPKFKSACSQNNLLNSIIDRDYVVNQ